MAGIAAEQVLGKAYDVRLIRRLAVYVKPHQHLLGIWVAFMLVTIGFELAQPYVFAYVLQHHIIEPHPELLPWDALLYVGLVVGQNLSSFCEQWFLQLAGQRTMHDLRISIFDHVLAQRAAFFDRIPVGRLMTRMTNDIESLNEIFAQGAITIIADVIKAVAIIGIMFWISVPLTLMTMVTFPFLIVLVEYARRAMRRSFRQIRVRLAAMNAFAQEHLFGIRVVQLLGRSQVSLGEYNEINAGHRDAYLEQIRADAAMYALVDAIGVIAIGAIVWWGAAHHSTGAITIAVIIAFIEYINRFFNPVRDLSAKYAVMQGAMAASERIFELLDTDELDGAYGDVTKGDGPRKPVAGAPAVELVNVQFSYGAEPVLRGVDIRIPKGATVAVVGATGSGKSTVIKLLTRLYERTQGSIRLDGVDVRDLPLSELRGRITVVSQDVTLFAGNLADNIALGKPFDRARLDAAVHRVGLDRALERRGDSIDCKVAERGSNFSAGERQLIAFARALLRDPEILILDEATAHVDPEAEELIERGVAELMKGRTTLVIAHRLSTIRNADLIVGDGQGARGGTGHARRAGREGRAVRRPGANFPPPALIGVSSRRMGSGLRDAIEVMADGAIVADTRAGEVIVNAAARVMLGIPPGADVDVAYLKEVVGFYPFDLAAGTDEAIREEVRIGDRVLHSVVTPLRDGDEVTGAIVILRDLGDTADVARKRAEFAQVMSHELRTPLTSIAGALDIVLSGYAGPLSDRQLRYVDMARQAATRMTQLVDQLLDLARAQAGTITVSAAPVHLDRLAREVIDRYRGAASAKQLSIALGASANDISIVGDPERLAQVLGNLVANAIRFAPSGGVIDVQVFGPPLSEDAVGVSVHNTGEEVAVDDREKIFEPFSASSRRVGGTALGLSISRTIVEAHGGKIWVESGPTGTKFVFTLPVTAKSEASLAPALDDHTRPRRRGLGEGASAMVVDDDPRRALLLKGLLMALTDRVLVANDVDAGLAIARAEHPALAVVAGAMVDALALLAILEHDPDTAKTAVMVVGDASLRADVLAAGADDLLEFPIQPAVFRDACLRLVESGRREAPRVLIVDDDPSIRQICREVLEIGGYQVRDAGSATLALAEARRFRPDMIVLDVLMPEIDGYRCAEMIRADAAIGMAPIMFLSARGDTADKVRAFRSGAEDYMVKPFDAAELLARVAKALDRQARELGASPTTQLPGADAIQSEIERRLGNDDAAAVCCYLDLDNLKAFNDYYGYAKANAVIRQTGDVIRATVHKFGNPHDFIGHIAGDDFVFVTTEDRVDEVCKGICESFDYLIKLYYHPGDRERGYIEAKDRFGVHRKFPIMTVSIAGLSLMRAKSYAALAELAAIGKSAAKAIPGSAYVRDGETLFAQPTGAS